MTFTKDDVKRVVWTFIQSGLAAAVLFISVQDKLPSDWTGSKQFAYALALAFIAGVFSAIKNWVTPTGSTLK